MRVLWFACLISCGGSTPAPKSTSSTPPEPPAAQVTQAPEAEIEKKPPIDDKVARDASLQFIDVLKASRGEIGRCHAAAVAKDAKLENRAISLAVAADFDATGALVKLALSPFISDEFEACVKATAASWKVTLPQKMSFKASINLAP